MNFSKGYNKVNPSETPKPHNNHRTKLITIFLTLSITLVLIICSLTSILTPTKSPSNSKNSLQTICSVTQFPKSCFSSISSLNTTTNTNTPNPLHFFNLSLIATTIEVSKLRNLSNSTFHSPAINDCAELFDESVTQLEKSSAALVNVGNGEKLLTEMRISDLQTWISAAMTDQDTCIDGLEEMRSTVVDEFKVKVKISNELLSNCLAILNNIKSLFDKFGLKMP